MMGAMTHFGARTSFRTCMIHSIPTLGGSTANTVTRGITCSYPGCWASRRSPLQAAKSVEVRTRAWLRLARSLDPSLPRCLGRFATRSPRHTACIWSTLTLLRPPLLHSTPLRLSLMPTLVPSFPPSLRRAHPLSLFRSLSPSLRYIPTHSLMSLSTLSLPSPRPNLLSHACSSVHLFCLRHRSWHALPRHCVCAHPSVASPVSPLVGETTLSAFCSIDLAPL